LHVKLLKRNANFDPQPNRQKAGTVAKFQIPKKTKLFVDQTMRERENSICKPVASLISSLDML